MINTIKWSDESLVILDQTKLPAEECYIQITDYRELISAIKRMSIRGAPALGVAGAFGMYLGIYHLQQNSNGDVVSHCKKIAYDLVSSRPTAVNLRWAVEAVMQKVEANKDLPIKEIKDLIFDEARRIHGQDIEICKKLGEFGADLIEDNSSILTHCNTGGLATGGYGTALGVIESAFKRGTKLHVYVDETRPKLQGSRLTAWELKRSGIDYTIISDNMAGYLMKLGKVGCIIVGADRIAANGDTANKIGTYSLSVLAKHHGVPFYIAAPFSTFDLSINSGEDIPIEFRNQKEITEINGIPVAPVASDAYNPAFDVTPGENITAIITDKGIFRGPDYTFNQTNMN